MHIQNQVSQAQLSQTLTQIQILTKMINQISVNSNNTIELSRGDLLAWVNDLITTNLTKIQQLGTGAIYCQMLDLLYPNKIQLNKVNFKAKNDYQYIANFKILQQYFTKFGIMKNIDIEKLIKCKYQDNLEFLQWFKKIFDTHFAKNQTDPLRRSLSDNEPSVNFEKQNKKPIRALNFDAPDTSKNNINDLLKLQLSKQGSQKPSHTATSRPRNDDKAKRDNSLLKPSTERHNSFEAKGEVSVQNLQIDETGLPKSGIKPKQIEYSQTKEPYYSPSKFIEKQNFYRNTSDDRGFCDEERQFYLKKFREIEHLLELHETNENCSKLVSQIRKVILIGPQIKDWTVNEQTGQVVCVHESQCPSKEPECQGRNKVTDFQPVAEEQLPKVQTK